MLISHSPAMDFADGYPIGNGRIGVMCFGGPARLIFVINHSDLWYRPSSQAHTRPGFWTDIQEKARAGAWEEVGHAIEHAFDSWNVSDEGSFQVGAFVELWMELPDGAWEYRRSLDIKTGIAATEFVGEGQHYSVQAAPDHSAPAASIKITTDNPRGIRGRLRLYRPADVRFEKPVTSGDSSRLRLGMGFGEGTNFEMRLAIQGTSFDSARIDCSEFLPISGGGHLQAQHADGHPDLQPHANVSAALVPGAQEILLQVRIDVFGQHDTSQITTSQCSDPQLSAHEILSRAELHLSGKATTEPHSPAHFQKLWEIGRYLLAASSHPQGLPPNLQGIWNDKVAPVCNSDWHLDLNLQMAMWHIPTGNLLEFHEPFFRLIDRLVPGARQNAACLFDMRGLAFPACTYGHGEGRKYLDAWVGTSGWLMQHYWKHWRYTLDREFLHIRFYPLLREVARFYLDYLLEDNGRLIILPSVSPENRIPERGNFFYGCNSTFDLAIFREVFVHLLAVAHELKETDALIAETRGALRKLADYPCADDGRLREMEDYEFQKGHRHLSHLYPLFPGDEITPENPRLFRAAELAIAHFRRWPTTGTTDWFMKTGYDAWAGWTYPWLACCYARLGRGDEALAMLQRYAAAFQCDGGLGFCFEKHDLGFGIHWRPDIGKWIEIDAACSATAAIQEMLLQSHGGVLRLLPACPLTWRAGSFRGFRAEGGFEVDADWDDRQRQIVVQSLAGQTCRVSSHNVNGLKIKTRDGGSVEPIFKDHTFDFATKPGASYEIEFRR